MNEVRYAIYHAPAVDSPWWRWGSAWLGWDEKKAVALAQPWWPDGTREQLHALTAEPRRYGFHATLKAPFRLARGTDEVALCRRVDQLASRLRRVALGRLVPVRIDDFTALEPAQESTELAALAARCVTELDDLRAPLTREDLARRRPESLPARARELLGEWGYPWVLDLFRFHMTVSGPVDLVTGEALIRHVAAAVEGLNTAHPPMLERLCVFREDHPGAPFVRIHDAELAP